MLGPSERAAACCILILWPCRSQCAPPRFDIHLPRRPRRDHQTSACKPPGAHGQQSSCPNSHATANRRRSRRFLVSFVATAQHPAVVAVTITVTRSTGSSESRAPPKSRVYHCGCNSLVLQSHCLFQLSTFPLLVSCRPSLAARIRLPARIHSSTTLSQDLPFLCQNDQST